MFKITVQNALALLKSMGVLPLASAEPQFHPLAPEQHLICHHLPVAAKTSPPGLLLPYKT